MTEQEVDLSPLETSLGMRVALAIAHISKNHAETEDWLGLGPRSVNQVDPALGMSMTTYTHRYLEARVVREQANAILDDSIITPDTWRLLLTLNLAPFGALMLCAGMSAAVACCCFCGIDISADALLSSPEAAAKATELWTEVETSIGPMNEAVAEVAKLDMSNLSEEELKEKVTAIIDKHMDQIKEPGEE